MIGINYSPYNSQVGFGTAEEDTALLKQAERVIMQRNIVTFHKKRGTADTNEGKEALKELEKQKAKLRKVAGPRNVGKVLSILS